MAKPPKTIVQAEIESEVETPPVATVSVSETVRQALILDMQKIATISHEFTTTVADIIARGGNSPHLDAALVHGEAMVSAISLHVHAITDKLTSEATAREVQEVASGDVASVSDILGDA
jgi:hypothetical protein